MKSKLQILGVIVAAIFALWLFLAIFGIAINIVMSKVFLLAVIGVSFVMFKKDRNSIFKYILMASIFIGIFVFDMIVNIVFLLLIVLLMQIIRRVNVKQVGAIQIFLLAFGVIYLLIFGIAITIAKLLAVFLVYAVFMFLIWKEIKIYFTPTPVSSSDEVDFVDQNMAHKASKLNEQLGRFFNMELMTKDVVINLLFALYILLVTIQMLSELIYTAITPFN